jgi:predicted dehydrogenase
MNRREFLKNTSVTAVSAAALFAGTERIFAAGTEKVKVALIGCGGRGTGALKDFKEAAAHLGIGVEVTALADFFMNRAKEAARQFEVSEDLCMEGANAYKKAIATSADVVLLVTPPNFRPVHFEAAVKAGKHVFMEKPVAVDPVGARKIMEMGEIAKQKNLVVVAGTQRRHQDSYLKTYQAIQKNAIGAIRGGEVWWCGGALWKQDQQPGESDASYMVRNWVSFAEMSGDHIVEQHVHNIDVANWFLGRTPETALGFGGRARRQTGNQFDFFSVDFDYGEGVHIHSMCRQVDGTYSRVSEFFTGTDGATWGSGPGKGKEGFARQVEIPEIAYVGNPYVQEHVDLLDCLKNGKPLNEAAAVASSTLTGIMGRIASYTGQLVRWKDLMDPTTGSPWYNLELKPSALDFEAGEVTAPADNVVPVPGK